MVTEQIVLDGSLSDQNTFLQKKTKQLGMACKMENRISTSKGIGGIGIGIGV